MSKDYYDDDPLEDYDDDRYLRGLIMAHENSSYAGDEKHYCGFNDYSKFEDVLKSIEESIPQTFSFYKKNHSLPARKILLDK